MNNQLFSYYGWEKDVALTEAYLSYEIQPVQQRHFNCHGYLTYTPIARNKMMMLKGTTGLTASNVQRPVAVPQLAAASRSLPATLAAAQRVLLPPPAATAVAQLDDEEVAAGYCGTEGE